MKKVLALFAILATCSLVLSAAASKFPADRMIAIVNKSLSHATKRLRKPPPPAKRVGNLLVGVENQVGGRVTYVLLGEIRDIDGVAVIFQDSMRVGVFIPTTMVDSKR